jgi:hypothetical protein
MDDRNEIKAVIRRVSGSQATLEVEGQTLTWPTDQLPDGAREGETVRLRMLTERQAETEYQERARALLTEILGGKS